MLRRGCEFCMHLVCIFALRSPASHRSCTYGRARFEAIAASARGSPHRAPPPGAFKAVLGGPAAPSAAGRPGRHATKHLPSSKQSGTSDSFICFCQSSSCEAFTRVQSSSCEAFTRVRCCLLQLVPHQGRVTEHHAISKARAQQFMGDGKAPNQTNT